MQNAFNKYGTDSFVCEILEIVTDKNILLKREEYYISLYDSYKNDIMKILFLVDLQCII